ncbi:MAG: CtsR family transcriptional regulator [Christensenellales bacterium]
MPLSDSIEQFIKDLMSDSESELEVKRNELAAYFGCAPSQINYVLATRFSPKHGYIIESRRGGSGYVRIIRMMSDGDQCPFIMALIGHIEGKLRLSSAEAMISALVEREIVTESEARLMRAAVSEEAINLPVNSKDILRANIMRSMLISLVTKSSGKGNREE